MGSDSARMQVAELATQFYAGAISYPQLMATLPDWDTDWDADIDELVDLISHNPKVGGFLGVSEAEAAARMAAIGALISKLSGGRPLTAHGVWPPPVVRQE
jgi:hypothetical protein